MKRLIITLIIIMSVFSAKAERYYYFEHLTTTMGLPSNTIYESIQDKNGFMWIGTRDGLCRYDGRSFIRLEEIVPEMKMNGLVMYIEEDSEGKIWFSSSNGVGYYNPATDELGKLDIPSSARCSDIDDDGNGNVWFASDRLYRLDLSNSGLQPYVISHSKPSMISVDSMGVIWILLQDGSVYTYDRLRDVFNKQTLGFDAKIIEATANGKMLMATTGNDVMLVDCISLSSTPVFRSKGRHIINCLQESDKGEFWIGTETGLFVMKEGEERIGEAFHDDATPNSISADFITCINKDRAGNLWIGTYYTGLNIWRDNVEDISVYFKNPSENSSKGKIVRDICSDSEGKIWYCTEDGFLNCLNPQTHEMKVFTIEGGVNMHALVMDNDNLWVCSFGKGLFLFDTNSGRVRKKYDFPNNSITSGLKTTEEDIYIGTMKGLYLLDKGTGKFSHITATGNDFIHCLYQDSKGVLWVGTYGNGILCLDKDGNVLSHTTPHKGQSGLTSIFTTSFHEDSRHRMWVTTEGGGVCHTEPDYNIKDLKFSSISRKDGLPSNITCSIIEDNNGMILVATANGIANISGNSLEIMGLTSHNDEVTGYQYSYGAAHKTRNGIIYMGNTSGMISLMPTRANVSEPTYPLSITSLEARASDRAIILNNPTVSATDSEDLKLSYKDASAITVKYVVPNYTNQNVLYHYRFLTGGGKKQEFSGTTDETSLTFTGLRPGKYIFEVGVLGSSNPNLNKRLGITIIPHPLLSRPAIAFYVIIVLALFAAGITILENVRKNDKARKIAKIISNKEKELYNAKINYFTNITHEIRTPLTLIKLPLDKIIEKGAYTPESEKGLLTIQENTDRLLNLTNQLLDMRKIEQNAIQLSCMKEDICKIVRKVNGYFEQMYQDRHINVTTDIPEAPIYIMCAKDSIVAIVSNLLSNAVKYCRDRVHIEVSVSDDKERIFVRVQSNGERIPENDKEKIFNIFFQREPNEASGRISQGTGLGLPYARTLANMHNGTLYLDMNVTEMNSFVLELPVRQENQIEKESVKEHEKQAKETPGYDSTKHTILIVEDTEEMRDYLADELSDTYNIFKAANGSDALDILHNEKVDLVISDIMMPIMDGCELCNRIKSDSDLSHVPVILLTAAIGVETRIETLKVGADGYIEKPFPIELLRSNISNLFKNKEISYHQFMNKPLTHYNSVTTSKVDEEFMEKLHEFIMKHISETDLNIESLTTHLGTSKSSLYRKVKANTGLSINEYIRVCRLKQAAELLASQKYKINEVAFMTGFSSPSYFATCFQKQFNISPSDFVKNLGQ